MTKRPTAADFDRLRQKIVDDINRTGRCVICVGADKDAPPFAYTVGNQLVDLPELLLIGSFDGSILNYLSEQMIERGRGFAHDELVSLGGVFPVKIVDADTQQCRDEWTIQANHIGRKYTVQQVVLCDRQGRYPDDPRCAPPYSTVPILWRTQ